MSLLIKSVCTRWFLKVNIELYSENAARDVTTNVTFRKESDKAMVYYIYEVKNYLFK